MRMSCIVTIGVFVVGNRGVHLTFDNLNIMINSFLSSRVYLSSSSFCLDFVPVICFSSLLIAPSSILWPAPGRTLVSWSCYSRCRFPISHLENPLLSPLLSFHFQYSCLFRCFAHKQFNSIQSRSSQMTKD